jgi:hypothetical protein
MPSADSISLQGTDDESANIINYRPFGYSGFQFHSANCHRLPRAAARRAPDFVPNTVDRSPLGRPPAGRNNLSEGEEEVVGEVVGGQLSVETRGRGLTPLISAKRGFDYRSCDGNPSSDAQSH